MATRLSSDYEKSEFTFKVDGDELSYIVLTLIDKIAFFEKSAQILPLSDVTKRKIQKMQELVKELI